MPWKYFLTFYWSVVYMAHTTQTLGVAVQRVSRNVRAHAVPAVIETAAFLTLWKILEFTWSHGICYFLKLASFTQHNIFLDSSTLRWVSVCHSFLLCVTSLCLHITTHLSQQGTFYRMVCPAPRPQEPGLFSEWGHDEQGRCERSYVSHCSLLFL